MKRLFLAIFVFATFSCIFAHTGYENDTGKNFIKTENIQSEVQFETVSLKNVEFNFTEVNKNIFTASEQKTCNFGNHETIFSNFQDDHPFIKIEYNYTINSKAADNLKNSEIYNKNYPGIFKSKPYFLIGNNYFRV